FHKLGSNADSYVIGKDFPRIAEVMLKTSDDGKTILAIVANGDGGEFAFYASDDKGAFTQLARFEDKIVNGNFGTDNDLYFLSRKGTPKGAILHLKRPFATNKPEVLVPEGDGVVEGFVATKSHLYTAELVGGPSRVRVFRLAN